MTRDDARSIALDAAGIMDAFRTMQVEDHDGRNRYDVLANQFGGFIGIAEQIVSAAEAMDGFRRAVSPDARWGEELPHPYEAWQAVARGLWERMGVWGAAEIAAEALARLSEELDPAETPAHQRAQGVESVMIGTLPASLRQAAVECVSDMGDIFWDYVADRDRPLEFRDPREVAVASVEKALVRVAFDTARTNRAALLLRSEYEALLAEMPDDSSDDQLIGMLVAHADWTLRGARVVVHLAREYGTSILRNALALAEVMGIEDGEAGL